MSSLSHKSHPNSAVAGVRALQQRFARAGYGPLLLARQRTKPSQLSNIAWLESNTQQVSTRAACSLPAQLLNQRTSSVRYSMPQLPSAPRGATQHRIIPRTAPPKATLPPQHSSPAHTSIGRKVRGNSGGNPAQIRGPAALLSTAPAAAQRCESASHSRVPHLTIPSTPHTPIVHPMPPSSAGPGSQPPRLHMAPSGHAPKPKKPRVPSQRARRSTRHARQPTPTTIAPPPTARSPRVLSEGDIAQAVAAARRRVQQRKLVAADEHAPGHTVPQRVLTFTDVDASIQGGTSPIPAEACSTPRYTPQELQEAEARLQRRAAAALAAQAQQAAAAQLHAQELQSKLDQVAHDAKAALPASPPAVPRHTPPSPAGALREVETRSDTQQAQTEAGADAAESDPLGPDLPAGVRVPLWSVHGSTPITSPIRVPAKHPSEAAPDPGTQQQALSRRKRPKPPMSLAPVRTRPVSPIRTPSSPPAAQTDPASLQLARMAAARRVAQRRKDLALAEAQDGEADVDTAAAVDMHAAAHAASVARKAAAERVAARRVSEVQQPRQLSRREIQAIEEEAEREQQRRRVYALNALCAAFTDAQFRRFDEQLAASRRRHKQGQMGGRR